MNEFRTLVLPCIGADDPALSAHHPRPLARDARHFGRMCCSLQQHRIMKCATSHWNHVELDLYQKPRETEQSLIFGHIR